MRCGANEQCRLLNVPRASQELTNQYDRYNVYAGRWHDTCWEKYGYEDFTFDESYAGENLEEV